MESLKSVVTSDGTPDCAIVYRRYPSRFWVLFVMSLLNFSQCLFWLSFSPVSENAKAYFGVTDTDIAWWLNMGPVAGMVCQIPAAKLSSTERGLLSTVRLTALICAVSMWIRLIPTWFGQQDTLWGVIVIYVAHFANGAAGPYIMGVPPMLSAQWFGDNERTTATAIAVMSNSFGMCAGFFLGPWLVNQPDQTVNLLWAHAFISLFNGVCVLAYFPAAPDTPPSASSSDQMKDLTLVTLSRDVLWRVLANPQLQLIAGGGGVVFGIFNVWSGSFNQILPASLGFDQTTCGMLGVVATVALVGGGILVGYITDLAPSNNRLQQFVLAFTALFFCFLGVATAALPLGPDATTYVSLGFWPVSVLVVVASFMLGAGYPLIYELCAKVTYPASASISGGIVVFLLNVGAFIFLFVLPPLLSYNVLNLIQLGAAAFALIAFFFVDTNKKQDGASDALLPKKV